MDDGYRTLGDRVRRNPARLVVEAIERTAHRDVAVRITATDRHPNYDTIATSGCRNW